LQWHPDKVPEFKREEAEERFKQIASAYEEALVNAGLEGHSNNSHEASQTETKDEGSRWWADEDQNFGFKAKDGQNDSTTSTEETWYDYSSEEHTSNDDEERYSNKRGQQVKSCAQRIHEDLSKDLEASNQRTFDEAIATIDRSWPHDIPACDRAAKRIFLSEVISHFQYSRPEIASHYTAKQNTRNSKHEAKLEAMILQMNAAWPHIDQWKETLFTRFLIWDCRDIAEAACCPEMRDTILKWVKERTERIDQESVREKAQSVQRIVDAFPNAHKIRNILKKYVIWERREIVHMLPEEIRAQLELSST